jgi:hypothetical protein
LRFGAANSSIKSSKSWSFSCTNYHRMIDWSVYYPLSDLWMWWVPRHRSRLRRHPHRLAVVWTHHHHLKNDDTVEIRDDEIETNDVMQTKWQKLWSYPTTLCIRRTILWSTQTVRASITTRCL